ncbi:DUF1501 domain-containing protein [Paucibacter soli]|uniref:DUF1501 domain-containing protein n=1 Tax=Paucibacter soli TaxID=3133433 RepID=UPI0030AC1F39
MTAQMKRRTLLQSAAFGAWAWAAPGRAEPEIAKRKLVVVMLRGAVDGLNVVVPYGDPAYARHRPGLAIPAPGAEGGALHLDRLFGLHPALAPLHKHWSNGQLGFVHASGSPDPTRSHFDAQDYMESGTPGRKGTPDGWMNRLLGALPGPGSATRGVCMCSTPARIFAGPASVASLGLGPAAMDPKAIDRPQLQSRLAQLYAADDKLAAAYRSATEGRQEMQRSMHKQAPGMDSSADAGAPSARSFAADARRLGQLIHADARTQLAFTSVGGWDTHVNQGASTGQLAHRLSALGEGLDALALGLGDSFKQTVIVVMSEFGRTVRQNGTGGTDHGRGNAVWLLGGPVAGAQVHGEWPGLEDRALADGRDLAVVSDFRHVLQPLLSQHLGLDEAGLAAVFPQLPAHKGKALRLLRA